MDEALESKLIVAIVQKEDHQEVTGALRSAGIAYTEVNARGGFLDQDNVILLIAAATSRVPQIRTIIASHCHERTVLYHSGHAALNADIYAHPTTVSVGGAVVFILDITHHERW